MSSTKIMNTLWDKFIKQEYHNYIVFTNNSVMPRFTTNYIDGNKVKIPYIMQVNTSCNPMILNINTIYMTDDKYLHCQPSLFHEFTHMWDSENLFIDKEFVVRNKFISFYTEYHASQIEFLRFIECSSADDINKVDPMDEFYLFDKKISVLKYYIDVCKSLFEKSCNYRSDKTVENYKLLMDAYMYVLGIRSMYEKIVGNITFPIMNDIFFEYMKNVYIILQEYEIDKLWNPLLENIDSLDIMFAKDFINMK